jgi:Uma2 family endonuclease
MRSSSSRSAAPAPIHAGQLRPGDPYELSEGRLVYCAPTGGAGSNGNRLGASVVGWDPAVEEAGVDTGYSPRPHMLRAPDVAVGNVPNKPGWVEGAPELAIEYADIGQDEAELKKKIAELLAAGTRYLWVVRLTGLRRVEVHEPRKKMRTVLPGEELHAPGVLKNPVRVEALYDRDAAERATLTNLLQRQGYEDLDAVLARGREEGREKGREEGVLLAKRHDLRRVLQHRKLSLTSAIEAEIDACTDLRKLDRWFDRALGASRIEEVFKRSSRSPKGA